MSNLHLAELAVQGLSRKERDEFIRRMTGNTKHARIISRRELAGRVGRSTRWVDQLVKRGIIRKIKLPDSSRAVGFLESEVEALLSGHLTRGESLEAGQ